MTSLTGSMPWHRNKHSFATAAFVAVGLCYPLLVYFGLLHLSSASVLWMVLAFVAVRSALSWHSGQRSQAWLAAAVLLVLAGLSSLETDMAIRFYPVAMNAGLALIFGWTLATPPSAIERLARLREPDLPESGIIYTRKVTWVWLCFFLVNGGIAVWTVWFASLEIWTLYNGLISYLAMGVLFAGEFLLRQSIRRKRG